MLQLSSLKFSCVTHAVAKLNSILIIKYSPQKLTKCHLYKKSKENGCFHHWLITVNVLHLSRIQDKTYNAEHFKDFLEVICKLEMIRSSEEISRQKGIFKIKEHTYNLHWSKMSLWMSWINQWALKNKSRNRWHLVQ